MRSKQGPDLHSAEAPAGSGLSRQLLQAQEEERRRITRELHDETGQALMVLRFQLEMLAGGTADKEQQGRIRESLGLLDRAIDGLRRTIARLSPRVLEELGLVVAIRKQVQLLARHTGMRSRLSLPPEMAKLQHDLQVAVYRSVQEALQNVAKHSHAKGFAVRLEIAGNRLTLEVEDDGVGFSPRAAVRRGLGLKGMRERANAFGGSLNVRSRPGKGARVRLVFRTDEPRAQSTREKPARRASAA